MGVVRNPHYADRFIACEVTLDECARGQWKDSIIKGKVKWLPQTITNANLLCPPLNLKSQAITMRSAQSHRATRIAKPQIADHYHVDVSFHPGEH
jgi:hypothetical protein